MTDFDLDAAHQQIRWLTSNQRSGIGDLAWQLAGQVAEAEAQLAAQHQTVKILRGTVNAQQATLAGFGRAFDHDEVMGALALVVGRIDRANIGGFVNGIPDDLLAVARSIESRIH
jgi:hypothetical protein